MKITTSCFQLSVTYTPRIQILSFYVMIEVITNGSSEEVLSTFVITLRRSISFAPAKRNNKQTAIIHQRAIMKRRLAFIVLFLHILVATAKLCQDIVRIKLEGDVQVHSHNGSISHNNVEYPEGTHWKDGSEFYGCPCKIKQCIRLCSESEFINWRFCMID